jgi:hypothetical protein
MVTFLDSLSQFGTTYTDLRWILAPLCIAKYDAQMTHAVSVLQPTLRMKAWVDSSKRGWKHFIYREEKRKAAWTSMHEDPETSGPMGRVGGLGFIAFLRIALGLRCLSGVEVPREGEVSPWPLTTFWDLLQSVLQEVPGQRKNISLKNTVLQNTAEISKNIQFSDHLIFTRHESVVNFVIKYPNN